MAVMMTSKLGKRAQVVRLLACAVALSLAGEAAVAEEQDAATSLLAGLQCAYVDPSDQLASNISRSDAGPVEVVMALRRILSDVTVCDAIKTAAEAKLADLSNTEQVVNHEAIVLARQRMESALREADQRATEMRFVVGPPPPRLTRNHPSVP